MFRITAEKAKIHWATDCGIAFRVCENLNERKFENAKVEMINQSDLIDKFLFDPGGLMLSNDDLKKWELLDGLVIFCKNQHIPILKNLLDKIYTENVENKYGYKLYKIHGITHVLCLNQEQMQEFYRKFRKTVFDDNKEKNKLYEGNV